jgi:hypothetical protein
MCPTSVKRRLAVRSYNMPPLHYLVHKAVLHYTSTTAGKFSRETKVVRIKAADVGSQKEEEGRV